MTNAATKWRPPVEPWSPLRKQAGAGAYLSVYLSSPLARLPVRDITRLGDNKSDPNLETLSYGMFSTCEPRMRTSIVNRSIGEIFFLTNFRGEGRVLTGYYKLGWHRPGPLTGATSSCAHHTLAHGIFPIRPPQPAREGRLFAVGRGGKAPPPSIPGRNTDDLIARSTHLRPQISP